MSGEMVAPPVLSSESAALFEDPTPVAKPTHEKRLTDDEIRTVYEIERTAKQVKEGGWKKIALQFPDGMLNDAPRVFEFLQKELDKLPSKPQAQDDVEKLEKDVQELSISKKESGNEGPRQPVRERLSILADTSYGACCVDEIAAEHVDAEVVVHYGRTCLSPTARLPVIYVFTTHSLDYSRVLAEFEKTFKNKEEKVVLMGDITYSDHLPALLKEVKKAGYTNVFTPEIIHNPSSLLPNRTIPPKVEAREESLGDYTLFHISDPPPSLLLTLSSRMAAMHIYSTETEKAEEAMTSRLLRRRYAILTSLNTCPIFGILINTLSVKNYLPTISAIQKQIEAAGKKSYTFVVGKVNAAKVANFSEIGGWVVVGCWESSLLESTEFFRPIITPFELNLALQSDEERVWTGEWNGDFSDIVNKPIALKKEAEEETQEGEEEDGMDDDEDSAPPEFDLRTGRYISNSRPMRQPKPSKEASAPTESATTDGEQKRHKASSALMKRANGDLAMINGTASPGAEYLRSQRTWVGLGSEFEIGYEKDGEEKGAVVEEGRGGVARGYKVGDGERH